MQFLSFFILPPSNVALSLDVFTGVFEAEKAGFLAEADLVPPKFRFMPLVEVILGTNVLVITSPFLIVLLGNVTDGFCPKLKFICFVERTVGTKDFFDAFFVAGVLLLIALIEGRLTGFTLFTFLGTDLWRDILGFTVLVGVFALNSFVAALVEQVCKKNYSL